MTTSAPRCIERALRTDSVSDTKQAPTTRLTNTAIGSKRSSRSQQSQQIPKAIAASADGEVIASASRVNAVRVSVSARVSAGRLKGPASCLLKSGLMPIKAIRLAIAPRAIGVDNPKRSAFARFSQAKLPLSVACARSMNRLSDSARSRALKQECGLSDAVMVFFVLRGIERR